MIELFHLLFLIVVFNRFLLPLGLALFPVLALVPPHLRHNREVVTTSPS